MSIDKLAVVLCFTFNIINNRRQSHWKLAGLGGDNIIALYIILGIILALYVILRFSLTVSYYVNSITDEVEVSAKWLFFPIYPKADKPTKIKNKKSKKKKKSKNAKKAKSENTEDDKFDLSKIESEFADITEEELDDRIKYLEDELENQEQAINRERESPKTDKKINAEKINKKPESKKPKRKKHIKESPKNKPDDNGLKAKINNAKKSWNKYKDFVPMTWKAFRKLLKQIRFYDTEIEVTAGKDDAYDAAMNYGRLNALLFNGLGVIGTVFSLYKPKRAEIKCVFDRKVFEYEISGKIKLRVSTTLGITTCFVAKFLYMFLRKRHKAKKQLKLKRKLMLNKQKELLANEG